MGNQVKLKVCGMRDHDNIMAVAALQPDYMGFIFYEKSPRFVGAEFTLPHDFPAHISRIGVFVNAPTAMIQVQAKKLALHYVQLHGVETPEQVRELKETGIKVVKVFSVDDAFDFASVIPYEGLADFFLFDTKGKFYGGNASTFNWNILRNYNQKVPFFLSGGISPENVEAIALLQDMNLHSLDVNSGVETAPGIKNTKLVHAILQQIESSKMNK